MKNGIISYNNVEKAKQGVLMLLNNAASGTHAESIATQWMVVGHLFVQLQSPKIVLNGRIHRNDFRTDRDTIEAAITQLQEGDAPLITLDKNSRHRLYCITDEGKKYAKTLPLPEEIVSPEARITRDSVNGTTHRARGKG